MFNSLEKAKELLEHFSEYSMFSCDEKYMINSFELNRICEDYITAYKECESMCSEIESLRNYIRLLEKENKELREMK